MQNQLNFEASPFAFANEKGATDNSPEYTRRLQQALNRASGLQLPLDGRMGFRTRKAIRNFQRQKGLPASHIVGRDTEKALFEERSMQTPQSNSRPPALSEETEFGDETGSLNFDNEFEYETKTNCKKDWCDPNYVRWVQQSLNRILGLRMKEDGSLGKETRSAIRSFQTKHGLKVDSSLGPATEKALKTAGAAAPPEIKQLPCGHTNTDELVKLLNKYRGDIPLNFLLGWIKVESGGRIDSLTNLCERGYFQVHPAEAKVYGIKNHQDISYNNDYSVQAGIQVVKGCIAKAKALADKYGLPKQGDLFWGLVKMHHWLPSGPEKILGDMKARGVKPAGWNEMKAYVAIEENRKRLAAILKGFDPMKGINNADKTLNEGKTGGQSTVRELGKVNRRNAAYVKWVQQSLNRIMRLQLAVDGDIGTQTRSAIRSFQQKQNLTADGIVGAQTEAALIAAGGTRPPAGTTTPGAGRTTPSAGRTSSAVNTPLPREGKGFYSHKQTSRQYGIPETIQALQAIGAKWYAAYPNGPRIGIGEISLQGGGDISGHRSHEKGVDVDIWIMRNDRREKPTNIGNPAEYSRPLTQELVNLIRANTVLKVERIYFNDTKVQGVRWWKGHDGHLHVRFCAPGDSACKPASQKESEFETNEWEMMDEYEVNPNSRSYIQWVQNSLNKILGLRLAADGKLGTQTRSAIRSFQQRAGLGADGIVGAKTERALIAAGASAPGGANVSSGGSNAPISSPSSTPTLIKQESVPPAQTLYVKIQLGAEQPAKPMTGIYLPQGFQPRPQVDLIIYLHGIKTSPELTVERYWNSKYNKHFSLREGLNASQKSAVLVAPTLGPRSQWQTGWLTKPGGLDKYVENVLAALVRYGPYKNSKPQIGNIILACHSGGGRPMRELALAKNNCSQNIKECWGFDCTYFDDDIAGWRQWATSRTNAKLYLYYIPKTKTQERALKIQNAGLPNVSVLTSPVGHNWVPIKHWQERLQGATFLK